MHEVCYSMSSLQKNQSEREFHVLKSIYTRDTKNFVSDKHKRKPR